jgi:hypothetical protein
MAASLARQPGQVGGGVEVDIDKLSKFGDGVSITKAVNGYLAENNNT